MIIYKATNLINNKVYIGQTRRTLEKRKSQHFKNAKDGVKTHFYDAIRKYGCENFKFEVICETDDKYTLNKLETFYIQKYDSIKKGYNMVDGGDNNIMDNPKVKQKHLTKMRSRDTRDKISNTLKQKYLNGEIFNDTHRKHLSESAMGNHNFGDKIYDTSVPCFCIIKDNGEKHKFHNYLDAGKWWFDTFHPFPYSACTYQRKIKQSINLGYATYGRGKNKQIFDNIRWYREGGDANEVTD